MMKKILFSVFFALFGCFLFINAVQAGTYVSKYNKTLSPSEKESICKKLQTATQQTPSEKNGLGGGIIPDEVLTNIYNATRSISNSISIVSALGDSLMCHAVHGNPWNVKIRDVVLATFPNIPIWLCGAIIYFFGFMLLLSITFYVVDVSFKLGFAIILMPIGVALWPFEKTKDKVVILISIFLKSAAILAFLAITVSYTVNMLSGSLTNLGDIFQAITVNDTDYIERSFSLASTNFLLVVAVLAYGMKLIGSTISNYVDKFFPDKAFGGASPMHRLATQAVDFAKQKVVAPVAKYAGDVVETQAGRGLEKVGKFARGGYHEQVKGGIKNIGVAVRNPKQTIEKARLSAAHGVSQVAAGAMKKFNDLKYGAQIAAAGIVPTKEGRQEIRNKIRNERDERNQYIDDKLAENYDNAKHKIDEKIQQREQDRLDDKQREHEERMNTDPAYKARFEHRQERKDKRQKRREERESKIGALDQRLEDINEAKRAHQVDTGKVFGAMNDFADKIKNGKGSARLLRSIQQVKDKAFENIDLGKFADKEGDKWYQIGYKAVGRGIQKAGVSIGLGVAQAPLALVSGAVNAGVETINTAAKAVAGVGMGAYNGVIGAGYFFPKVAPTLKRAWYKIPDAAVNILKAPGTIIENTGQAMQRRKKR